MRPDYIVCLEDGKRFKTLKRHLRTRYGMTPNEYRAKWNLAGDYPMVAPHYVEQRRSLTRQIGLDHKPATQPMTAARALATRSADKTTAETAVAKSPRKRLGISMAKVTADAPLRIPDS